MVGFVDVRPKSEKMLEDSTDLLHDFDEGLTTHNDDSSSSFTIVCVKSSGVIYGFVWSWSSAETEEKLGSARLKRLLSEFWFQRCAMSLSPDASICLLINSS